MNALIQVDSQQHPDISRYDYFEAYCGYCQKS